ncbi:hypothetical protein ACHAWF_008268 [Thalassiosira exigua]
MGNCKSKQQAAIVGVADAHPCKPTVEPRQGIAATDPADSPSEQPSTGSHTTGVTTRESSELLLESAPVPADPTIPPGYPIPPVISNITVPQIESNEALPSTGPKHRRVKSSGLVKDYLQAEGAASNRVMVHIETPFGKPIEEVYDGVHTGKVLGEGVAGEVRRITHRDTGIQRAVKRLDLGLVTSDDDLDRLLDEIKIMCCLDHIHVVCLEEVFEGENELFLTQELCKGGDLFDRLEDQPNSRYREADCARLIRQIISSVTYLHSKDIIHRDLKLENFLFQDDISDSLKMIDFGLSKHFVRGEVQHESVGTPYTVAPEVILGEGYDEKCDIWGIGVLTYLLLSGETPFGGDCPGDDLLEVKRNILSGVVSFEDPVWNTISEDAVSFIKSLLVLNPEERPNSSELKDHPWLKSMKRNSSITSEVSSQSLNTKVVDGLVSFKDLSGTRKFLREIVSYTLLPEQMAGLHEEFEKIDVDDKGEISLECFKEALVANSDQHPFTETEIEEIFEGLKVRNTDMSIRWHEFIAACLSQCSIDDRNIMLAFERLDNDRKGFITLSDMKEALEFYGSDSRHDLQSVWVNNVMDYRSDKDHMTYDDFYKLLLLDEDEKYSKETNVVPPRHKRDDPLARSCIENGMNDIPSKYRGYSRRHSAGPLPLGISKVPQQVPGRPKTPSSTINQPKGVCHVRTRKASITGTKGLLLRRESNEFATYVRAHSDMDSVN